MGALKSDESVPNGDSGEDNPNEGKVAMKKTVTLFSAIAMIAGSMIGSGIFVSPRGVLLDSGSVGVSLLVWSGCGILAMFGALVYAELGSSVHQSGAEYSYLMVSMSPLNRHIGALPAFLYNWTGLLLRPSSVAIISLAFSEYALSVFFDECGPPKALVTILTIATIMSMAAVSIYSARLGYYLQSLTFVVKSLALLGIIGGGMYKISQGHTEYLREGFKGTAPTPSGIARAFYNGLWAYDGWNNLNYVTEEIQNPQRNVPLAIGISLPFVTIVYLLTNIAYFSVLAPTQILASNAVAVEWAQVSFPTAAWVAVVVTLCVACSTYGAANGSLISSTRLVYSAARNGHIMDTLAMVDVNRSTPSPSIVFQVVIGCILAIASDIASLIDFFSFSAWIFYGLTMVAFLILRWKEPDRPRPFKCPIAIAVIVLLASIYLVIAPIIDDPDIMYLVAFIYMASGIIFYFLFVILKLKLPLLDHFTVATQKLLQVAPTHVSED